MSTLGFVLAILLWRQATATTPAQGMAVAWCDSVRHRVVCLGFDGKEIPPEPTDVPAIQTGKEWCSEKVCYGLTYTCADKTRVLLTSEDGKKHCYKLEP